MVGNNLHEIGFWPVVSETDCCDGVMVVEDSIDLITIDGISFVPRCHESVSMHG